jgi:hypothetical protein
LVFGDDFFELWFDAIGILVPGKMDEVCHQLFVKFLSRPKSNLLDFNVDIGFKVWSSELSEDISSFLTFVGKWETSGGTFWNETLMPSQGVAGLTSK